ncbi:MAG: glutamate racemase [Clostridiales bacterium]|nr:glutamate racemase [Candidatus Equinaster intestinalis]
MADNRPIGIFDSGLGGLTVMKEIVKLLPNENIIYFGDTGRVPYGTRSRNTIRKYAVQDENFLLKHSVKIIVAACGTVSAVAADTGKALPVPFFEVISTAAQSAVSATKNGKIGVIGTPATISSGEHAKKIKVLLPSAEIFMESCPLFVPLVEEGLFSESDPVVLETATRYLEPLKQNGIDTLVLGCTHYPLLAPVISKVMGEEVKLINMGEAAAISIKDFLTENGMLCDNFGNATHKFFVSDMTESFGEVANLLLGEKISENNAEQVDINSL